MHQTKITDVKKPVAKATTKSGAPAHPGLPSLSSLADVSNDTPAADSPASTQLYNENAKGGSDEEDDEDENVPLAQQGAKKKLFDMAGLKKTMSTNSSGGKTPSGKSQKSTPKSSSKKRKAGESLEEDEDGALIPAKPSPSKRAKRAPKLEVDIKDDVIGTPHKSVH